MELYIFIAYLLVANAVCLLVNNTVTLTEYIFSHLCVKKTSNGDKNSVRAAVAENIPSVMSRLHFVTCVRMYNTAVNVTNM